MNGFLNDIVGPVCAVLCVVGLIFLAIWLETSNCKKIRSENFVLRSKLVEKEIENELLEVKCRDMANQIYLLSETNNKKSE